MSIIENYEVGLDFNVNDKSECVTLRDKFASSANPATLSVYPHDAENLLGRKCPIDSLGKVQWQAELHATLCFIMADAMLKERSK